VLRIYKKEKDIVIKIHGINALNDYFLSEASEMTLRAKFGPNFIEANNMYIQAQIFINFMILLQNPQTL
jgi:hypothetical protein